MSSHHFVKDQQEPALLILDTGYIGYEQVAPLLEWVPTVLVAQGEIFKVLSWQIKVDVILAEINFQKNNYPLLEAQYPVRFLGVKDGNFVEEGLAYLIASKHTAVNIIGYDHTLVFDLESKLNFLDIVIWDGPMRYVPAKNGQFKKWFRTGSLQLHAPEGSFVEMITGDRNDLIQIRHATMVEVEEGVSVFKSNVVFWIGEFVERNQ